MSHEKKYPFLINGSDAESDDRTPTPFQMLSDAGFEPPEDYMLVEQLPHGTREVSTDEPLDLEREGGVEVYAFPGGVGYRLTVNQHSILWGQDHIDISLIRRFARVPDDHDLIWTREEASSEILPQHGSFVIGNKGIEHLVTHERPPQPRLYEYFVGDTKYTTDQERLTGAQIVARIPDWNSANTLVLEGDGSAPDEPIHASTVVDFKDRTTPARFTITPPATFGMR